MVCSEMTRLSWMAGDFLPRMSRWEAAVKSARPAMGRYSWFRSGSLRRSSSAYYTAVSKAISSARVVQNTHLLHHRQHPWLGIVVPIRPNPQVDLLRVAVLPVRRHQPEQRVLGRLRHHVGAERRDGHIAVDGAHVALDLSESVVGVLFGDVRFADIGRCHCESQHWRGLMEIWGSGVTPPLPASDVRVLRMDRALRTTRKE